MFLAEIKFHMLLPIMKLSKHRQKNFDGTRCEVWYQGRISPDFYGWVFPHGDKTSVGVGSANKGFSFKVGNSRIAQVGKSRGCKNSAM